MHNDVEIFLVKRLQKRALWMLCEESVPNAASTLEIILLTNDLFGLPWHFLENSWSESSCLSQIIRGKMH